MSFGKRHRHRNVMKMNMPGEGEKTLISLLYLNNNTDVFPTTFIQCNYIEYLRTEASVKVLFITTKQTEPFGCWIVPWRMTMEGPPAVFTVKA